MRCTRLLLATTILFIASQAALAQSVHYKGVPPKDPDSRAEVGIVAYDLSRHGKDYSIELQGVDGVLATCKIRLEITQEVTCNLPDRGDFKMLVNSEEGVEYKNLGTGESVRYVFERIEDDDPRAADPDTGNRLSTPGFLFHLEGSLTHQDVVERWGDISKILRHALAEVEHAFPEERIRIQKEMIRLYDQKVRLPVREQSWLLDTENLDFCPNGEEVCSFSLPIRAAATGNSSTNCCLNASFLASDSCFRFNDRDCCANGLC